VVASDVDVVDAQAHMDVAGVGGSLRVGMVKGLEVLEELEGHTSREVEPGSFDPHVRVPDEAPDAGPGQGAAIAR